MFELEPRHPLDELAVWVAAATVEGGLVLADDLVDDLVLEASRGDVLDCGDQRVDAFEPGGTFWSPDRETPARTMASRRSTIAEVLRRARKTLLASCLETEASN